MTKLQGFTLIELMIAMGLLSSLAVVILATSVSGTQSFARVDNVNKENTAFADAIGRIDRHVRTALEFPTSYTAPDQTQYTVASQESDPTLIMKVRSIRADGTPCDTNFDYLVYTYAAGILSEHVYADPISDRITASRVLMNAVTSPTAFQQVKENGKNRSVTITLTHTTRTTTQETARTRTQTMVARND